ncbi:MAG: hypothetical protein FJZ00_04750, partial [Candidatus Sericytochromatia bacterium]|nr:hypothetical protein [Candidatus Tanganyikabacteria bacterium]
ATFSLTVGATADLSAVAAMDEDAPPSQEISYSVDKPSILSVAKGATTQSGLKATVTAIAAGTATVTARSDQDPTKSASLAIEVK